VAHKLRTAMLCTKTVTVSGVTGHYIGTDTGACNVQGKSFRSVHLVVHVWLQSGQERSYVLSQENKKVCKLASFQDGAKRLIYMHSDQTCFTHGLIYTVVLA
jgi:hypothetical protein